MKKNHKKPKIVFIGTPQFGAIILEKLIKSSYPPFMAITASDKQSGRKKTITPSAVKLMAQKYGLLLVQNDKIINLKSVLEKEKPDLGLVAAFGQIIPKEILTIARLGFLNVHPSLLPKLRGPSPIQFAILNNELETGISIIQMTEKLDAGPIITQKKINIAEKKLTYPDLDNQLAKLAGEVLVKTIPLWLEGKIKAKPQNDAKASYTKILNKKDAKLDFCKSASFLERKVRAFYPWPGSYFIWQTNNKEIKVKILKAKVFKSLDKKKYAIGQTVLLPHNEIGIQCQKDFLIIEKLQLEGKRATKAQDFLRGHKNFIGSLLK